MSESPPPARKSLGQNFLRDRGLARKIVQTLRVESRDQVLEIGPGPGILTFFLLEAAPAGLLLVEKDPYWAARRREEALSSPVPLTVIAGDALALDWTTLAAPCKIIGNLPYNVASPLMWDICSRATALTRAVFMIQKEVGERVAAAPSRGAYGALSVWMQSFCRPRLEFSVPPQVFRPRPKVWSSVLSFEPLPLAERPEYPDKLALLLKAFFQQRRKQAGSILRFWGRNPEILERCGIRYADRPENIDPATYKKLAGLF
jgi:16S rRNA (adenine1518-N6/adenine1519-N6)-dimethyltransferase